MTQNALFSSALIATLLLAGCATADRPAERPDRPDRGVRQSGTFVLPVGLFLSSLDKDSDKRVSRAELDAGITAEWAQFDRSVSAIGLSQWSIDTLGSTDAMPTFLSFDRDFNGVVSEDEFTKKMTAEFTRLDQDKDGFVSRSEMIISFAAPEGRAQSSRQDKKGQGGGREQGGRPPRR